MNYEGLLREAKSYMSFLTSRSHTSEVRFLILRAGRTGSSLLVDLLDSHESILCEGEILNHKVILPRLYVKCRASICQQKAHGFKLLSSQLRNVQHISQPRLFLQSLHDSGWKIIHLLRRNTLRQALSNLYARHCDRFIVRMQDGVRIEDGIRVEDGPIKVLPMWVDVRELLAWMEGLDRRKQYEQDLLRDIAHVEVVYESDLQDSQCHQGTVERIVEYLGLPCETVTTDMIKVTPRVLSDFVANHADVVEFVKETQYREWLQA